MGEKEFLARVTAAREGASAMEDRIKQWAKRHNVDWGKSFTLSQHKKEQTQ